MTFSASLFVRALDSNAAMASRKFSHALSMSILCNVNAQCVECAWNEKGKENEEEENGQMRQEEEEEEEKEEEEVRGDSFFSGFYHAKIKKKDFFFGSRRERQKENIPRTQCRVEQKKI